MILWPEETLAESEQIFQQVCTGMKNFWNDPFGWYGRKCEEYGEMSDGEWVRGLSAEATCEIVGVGLGRYVDEMADMARAADNVTGTGTKVDDVVEGGAQGVDEAGSGVQRTNDVGGGVSGNHNSPMNRDSAGPHSQQPDELHVDLEGWTRIEDDAPGTVDTGPRKKYKFRDSTDDRLRERFPEAFDDNGRVRSIEVDGKTVYVYNRNHVVADELSRSIIEECLNQATSRAQQARILRELGYDPARFGGSIEDAAKAWRRDVYNKDSNLWMGDAAENQAKGREIPQSDGNMMDVDGKESPRVDPNPTGR